MASGSKEERLLLPLRVGEYCHDWKKSQDICLSLIDDDEEAVRANAALGLAYVARTKGRLEKHRVKPALLMLLKTSQEYRWRIIDAIEDINMFLDWKIGQKAVERFKNESDQ